MVSIAWLPLYVNSMARPISKQDDQELSSRTVNYSIHMLIRILSHRQPRHNDCLFRGRSRTICKISVLVTISSHKKRGVIQSIALHYKSIQISRAHRRIYGSHVLTDDATWVHTAATVRPRVILLVHQEVGPGIPAEGSWITPAGRTGLRSPRSHPQDLAE